MSVSYCSKRIVPQIAQQFLVCRLYRVVFLEEYLVTVRSVLADPVEFSGILPVPDQIVKAHLDQPLVPNVAKTQ